MQINSHTISFQEVPNEISLVFVMVGCTLGCKNCHSSNINQFPSLFLSVAKYIELLNFYEGYITCVTFLGGEWNNEIHEYLKIAKDFKLKTCLYTGQNEIKNDNILRNLNYLKTGPYVESLGGLKSKMTNQRFYEIDANLSLKDLTYLFWEKNDKTV